ncbi:MAG: 4-(cytidine 5'-diphospho)-2-C-methyl-D-erythritol kinase [Ferruginibacter sp.]|nr:4-(cytidine 5'-diphospho)-2-C-methyl-D-erythritol kinase [Ferruginibacter sp.]
MISFPNCKINLGLHVVSKRADGFHNIETIFYPVPLRDALEINVAKNNSGPDVQFTSAGLPIPGDTSNNLCVKAYEILKTDFPALPPIAIHLLKAIPMGAGLGGGSADGAFTLKAINTKFELGLTQEQLLVYALQLGSDCPFFIINQPCVGTGRGEILEPISLALEAFDLVIVNPGIHVNTGWAFSQLNLSSYSPDGEGSLKHSVQQPVSTWKDILTNDFEEPVFSNHPELLQIKNSLYTSGAVYCSMSGSGSSLFGLLPKDVKILPTFSTHYLVKRVKL